MTQIAFLVTLTFLVCAEATSVNLILQDGAHGAHVVDATVSRITSTCTFGDDKRFLRRLAYVETKDGTDATEFNGGTNGGIWKITNDMFNALGSSSLDLLKNEISKEFGIDWAKVTYADLGKPLYSALASSLYIQTLLSTSSNLLEVPRSITDQSNFWANYYRPGAIASDFETRATEFEDSQSDCNVGADIVFIIDESGSIGSNDFETEKDFVIKVIENLVIGPDANQAGIITYGSYSDLDIKLDDFHDVEALTQAVKNIQYSGGGTATYLALQQLTDEAFTDKNGARPKDQGHPRVGIVLTDGGSSSKALTQSEAQRAKDAGIILFSIGVGTSVYVPELEDIASEPTCRYYSQLNAGFAEILDLVASISATTCEVPVHIEPNDTLIKPVDKDIPYNCEITVTKDGATVQIATEKGNLTFFLSETTYPSAAYFDAKHSVKDDETAAIYLPSDGNGTRIIYCSILSGEKTNVTIITKPGTGYTCAAPNPCSKENTAANGYYFPHVDATKFVQCDAHGNCFEMPCAPGTKWNDAIKTCDHA